MRYQYVDLAMTSDGDLILHQEYKDANGEIVAGTADLSLYSMHDALDQAVTHRLTTRKGDCRMHPAMGHELDTLIGRRITPELIEEGQRIIERALTYDGLIRGVDLKVIGLPFNTTTVIYHVEISNGMPYAYRFDLLYDRNEGTRRI